MSGTTAKPPAFHLRVRLTRSHGVPFAHHQVHVTWGKDKVVGTTDAKGLVDLAVDGDPAIKSGLLEVGPPEGKPYATGLAIPLVKHDTRRVSSNLAWRTEPPLMFHDVAWRLANLGYFTDGPARNDPDPYPTPLRVQHMADAMLRFKAHNHAALGLVDWLDPSTSTSKHRLTGDQDDASVALLLFQHDTLAMGQAAEKVDDAKHGKQPL